MSTLYSEAYRQELLALHSNPIFGNLKSIPDKVKTLLSEYNINSILDFGCGKGLFVESMKKEFPFITSYGFDPSHKLYNQIPNHNVDMIVSFDVLEHIEPENLNNVLGLLHLKCNKVMHHLIACHPAKRFLSDGRNAHLIIEEPNWWRNKFNYQGWKIIDENVVSYLATPKKGMPINVTKYFITVEKDGTA